MQFTLATLAALAAASIVSGQTLAPSSSAPAGCSDTFSGPFEISVSLPTKKRDIEERQPTCSSTGTLVATLTRGVLTDSEGRIGEVVANHQFQFDGPPAQAGTIFDAGWSVCNNGSLALGGSAIFYQCLSGAFYNLYDTPAGSSCEPVIITIIPCTSGGGATQEGATQITDGQIQATSAVPVSQATEGQIQATSAAAPVSQASEGQIQASSATKAPVSQASEGQIQATIAVPVSQATEGQIQATSATKAPVSQATEGQIQATTAVPVSQATEGQVQVTATPSSNLTRVSATPSASSPSQVTHNPAPMMTAGAQVVLAIAGFVAVAML